MGYATYNAKAEVAAISGSMFRGFSGHASPKSNIPILHDIHWPLSNPMCIRHVLVSMAREGVAMIHVCVLTVAHMTMMPARCPSTK